MGERKIASYFELVDLVDKIFPPKNEFDYTKITVRELMERLDQVIEESGFYFKEETIVSARHIIEENQRYNVDRKTNFVGGGDGSFDQNNYSIQNLVSKMKTGVLRTLYKPREYQFLGETFDTRELGSTETLRPRMAKAKVKEYVSQVLTSTWENRDTLRIEEYSLASDILAHFGLINTESYGNHDVEAKLARMIDNMVMSSRDFLGKRHPEGYYDRSETNRERHPEALDEAIYKITEYLYTILRDTLDRTEDKEKEYEAERQKREAAKKPKGKVEEEVKDETIRTGEPIGTPGVSVTELETTKSKYEAVQAIAQENAELEKELEELRKKAAEIEARIKANDEKIAKTLKLN